MIQRIVFSGSGGQGVITAALVYAEAALYYAGLNAVQTQVYGPEARGGSARSDVIVADSEIWFPKVLEPNVLVCLSQNAYDKYSPMVRPGGVVITDPHFVKRWVHASSREVEVRLYDAMTESDAVGPQSATLSGINMCLLGALAQLIPVVGLEAIRNSVVRRFGESHRERNLRALEIGATLVSESIATF